MNLFPIFADLNDQMVLVVGGGSVAERKIQNLLDAGAEVQVVARELTPNLQAWLDSKNLHWLAQEFSDEHVQRAMLIIAATDDNALNERVSQVAKAAYKLVNVVDTAHLCNFIVPAVIDRSPMQIAVTSGATSPVLARQIRLEIEQLIPLHYGLMADIAAQYRPKIKQEIDTLAERRRFWEDLFANSEFQQFCSLNQRESAEQVLLGSLKTHMAQKGVVTLVGAGPGDAGLLTLHALHAIQEADVVLYDALISDEIMRLVRKDAEKVYVGKRARNHQVAQQETNELLLDYAQKGLRVVRLKGGDPFVFGRGGEELAQLQQAGIACRIIPGITAAIGAAAYTGIPLTHRDYAQSLQFITGHCQPDGSDVDWCCYARKNQTLVIYMGSIQAAHIQTQLINAGRAADTPVAIVSHATRASQSVLRGTLSQLSDLAKEAPTPALLIIGEVAALGY